MKKTLGHLLSRMALSCALLPHLFGQQNNPHIGYVYPAGGCQGSTFQVNVGGQFLDGASGVRFSGEGVSATVLEHKKPPTPQQVNQWRQQVQELQKKGKDPVVLAQILELRTKIAGFNRNANPVIAESVTLQVTVASGAEPGARELRLGAAQGLSNPLSFFVGRIPEICEPEPKASPAQASAPAPAVTEIALPAVVNGRIIPGGEARAPFPLRPGQQFLPGDVDRYRFRGRKGASLVVSASARELIPYLADAVPGWFQATVALFDGRGSEVAYVDDFRFHPDPVLRYDIPSDGEYSLEIKDALYRGREDFVYRVTVGELPYVTGIFPLGGRTGRTTKVALSGWNLPSESLTVDAAKMKPGLHPLSVRMGNAMSNAVPFSVDELPEALEHEPNNAQRSAQRLALPVIVNGRIDRPDDRDVFAFKGNAGDRIVAEVAARRLDSPLDSLLVLTDASGLRVAANDDHEDKASGLNTHHADSLIVTTLPSAGTFYLALTDAQRKGGSEYAYRLRVSPPRPDFELRVTPSSVNTAPGATVPVTVYALRKDGFSEDIELTLKEAPSGLACGGCLIPAGQDRIRITLSAPAAVLPEPLRMTMEGRAAIGGTIVARTAVPAEDLMQAFAYRHLVPAVEWLLTVGARPSPRVPMRVMGRGPLRIPEGGRARVTIGIPSARFFEKVEFELSEPPEGITLGGLALRPQAAEVDVASDAAKAKAGLRGNLIVLAFGERVPAPGSAKQPPNRRRIQLGTLPAIPFEIVAP